MGLVLDEIVASPCCAPPNIIPEIYFLGQTELSPMRFEVNIVELGEKELRRARLHKARRLFPFLGVCFLIVIFCRSGGVVLGALGALFISWGAVPMFPAAFRVAILVRAPAWRAAPLLVSCSVAVVARGISSLAPILVTVGELRDLIARALVKTIAIDLHELVFDDLKAPTLASEVGPRRTLSSFEARCGFHISEH